MIRNLALILLLSAAMITLRASGSPLHLEDIKELLTRARSQLDQDEGAEGDNLVPSRSTRPWGSPFFLPIGEAEGRVDLASSNGDKEELGDVAEEKAKMLSWLRSRLLRAPRIPKVGEEQQQEEEIHGPRTTLREATSVLIPRWEGRRGWEESAREAALHAAVDAELQGILRNIAPFILRKIRGRG